MKCKECDYEIQGSPAKCPYCGANIKKSSLLIILGFIVLSAFLAFLYLWLTNASVHDFQQPPTHTAERGKQESLRNLIQGYIADGILLKVEKGPSKPIVYITPLFGSLTASEKYVILEVVLTYFKNDDISIDSIDLYESQTERPIGHFDGEKLSQN